MQLKDYLEEAETAVGGRKAIAEALDQHPDAITNAKAHRRGLPVWACIKLAKIINVNPMEVIAASELVMEKREDRKAVFLPFVQAARHVQHLMIAGFAITTALTLAFENQASTIRAFLL